MNWNGEMGCQNLGLTYVATQLAFLHIQHEISGARI